MSRLVLSENLVALEALLEPLGRRIRAESGEEALRLLLAEGFARSCSTSRCPGWTASRPPS